MYITVFIIVTLCDTSVAMLRSVVVMTIVNFTTWRPLRTATGISSACLLSNIRSYLRISHFVTTKCTYFCLCNGWPFLVSNRFRLNVLINIILSHLKVLEEFSRLMLALAVECEDCPLWNVPEKLYLYNYWHQPESCGVSLRCSEMFVEFWIKHVEVRLPRPVRQQADTDCDIILSYSKVSFLGPSSEYLYLPTAHMNHYSPVAQKWTRKLSLLLGFLIGMHSHKLIEYFELCWHRKNFGQLFLLANLT